METLELEFKRDQVMVNYDRTSDFKIIENKHILSKDGGHITFPWCMEMCGNRIWWTIRGYFGIGDNLTAVKITYYEL